MDVLSESHITTVSCLTQAESRKAYLAHGSGGSYQRVGGPCFGEIRIVVRVCVRAYSHSTLRHRESHGRGKRAGSCNPLQGCASDPRNLSCAPSPKEPQHFPMTPPLPNPLIHRLTDVYSETLLFITSFLLNYLSLCVREFSCKDI